MEPGFVLNRRDEALYLSCKEGCRRLSKDFDRKNLACKMLVVIEKLLDSNN